MSTSPGNTWMGLCMKYRSDFENQKDQVVWLKAIASSSVARSIMLMSYNFLVYKKVITIMEDLPVDQKENIWETAKDIADGKLMKNELIDFCRCLYGFEYVLNL